MSNPEKEMKDDLVQDEQEGEGQETEGKEKDKGGPIKKGAPGFVSTKPGIKGAADPDKVYEILRNELSYEANLIAHRTNWFVASQAFFFGSLATALNRSPDVPFTLKNSLLFPLIPQVALIVCIVICLSVLAAMSSVDRIRAGIKSLAGTSPLAAQFSQRNTFVVLAGLLPSFILPIVFAACWVSILVG